MEFHQFRVGKTSEVKAATREEDWRTMFPAPTVRIVNWNLEWAKGNTPKGRAIQDRIAEIQPHVACLTESHTNFYATGSVITSDADYGYGDEGTRRKVVLWSQFPWTDVTTINEPRLPGGRFVAGTTLTSLGPIRFVGVCIPWKDAHVRTGRMDRDPWQDHEQFLQELPLTFPREPLRRFVLLGDFNQTIPRTRAPQPVYNRLRTALGSFNCATSGTLPTVPRLAIDHVCHSHDLVAGTPVILSNRHEELGPLSDHFGIGLTLRVGS